MIQIDHILVSGLIVSLVLSTLLVLSIKYNPRLWLHDYPSDIQALVQAKDPSERRIFMPIGTLFMLMVIGLPIVSLLLARDAQGNISFIDAFIHLFAITMIFNLVDLLILDWWMFCMWTPSWLVIPGTEGAKGYKNYRYHFRGFLIGTLFSLIYSFVIAMIVSLL